MIRYIMIISSKKKLTALTIVLLGAYGLLAYSAPGTHSPDVTSSSGEGVKSPTTSSHSVSSGSTLQRGSLTLLPQDLPDGPPKLTRRAQTVPVDSDWKRWVRVLMVDDTPIQRKLGAFHLEKQGIHKSNIVTVEGGDAALQLLYENQRFDLVLMDYNMPNGNGDTFTQKMREYERINKMAPAFIVGFSAADANEISGMETAELFKVAGANTTIDKSNISRGIQSALGALRNYAGLSDTQWERVQAELDLPSSGFSFVRMSRLNSDPECLARAGSPSLVLTPVARTNIVDDFAPVFREDTEFKK